MAAAGFALPAALGIASFLVPVTTVCWIVLMVGAMATHGRRNEPAFVALNLIYPAFAAFLAWSLRLLYRLTPVPNAVNARRRRLFGKRTLVSPK